MIICFSSCKISDKVSSEAKETKTIEALAALESGFKNIPDSIQTSVYWYWISDNISKEGVINDLKSMKKIGINRAFIGNIGLDDEPYRKVKMFSDEWWDILHTALKTATELNIEIGIFNGPGWSQSGGPWIKPSQAMRYLTSSELEVKGPKKLNITLEQPNKEFQDVRVIAFPKPKAYDETINDLKPRIYASSQINNLASLFAQNATAEVKIPIQDGFFIAFDAPQDFTARSLIFYPAHQKMKFQVEIQAELNGQFQTLKTVTIDRSNDALITGFNPYAPAAVSLPSTTAKKFKIVFHQTTGTTALIKLIFSASPRVENYAEKTLAKMYSTPLPLWKEYQWQPQPVFNNQSIVINPNQVIDVSEYMDANGNLNWQAPAGEWIIRRTGMTPTQVTNHPAPPEGTGLEVDKMSKEHVTEHFNAFLGKILERIPPEDRRTWKVTVEDSYETGGQNWTDGMITKFKAQFGYSPLPYLPVMNGDVVGSEDQSDRFLWDLRRFIANEIAYQYVAGLREVSHQHGLHTWLENYGHWGFASEFLMYGGQSDEIGGEFWSEGELGNIENRAASSAAHIYGKRKVSAESFTAAGKTYARYPEMMKQRGDRFFTEGINNTLLHLFIEQAYEDKWPGVNARFGNEFNRKNTWFDDMDMFIQYLKRCNLMLQQGTYVADVAYFIGEDAPKMTGVRDPELPEGYAYDYINAEVIENRLTVKNGRLTLPDGLSYKILVLPKLKTMRPELLKKLKKLVSDGAIILGPRPERSPSLENYPNADAEVKNLATELWGNINCTFIKEHDFGKGKVLDGMDVQEALNEVNIIPDYNPEKTDSTLFIHRTLAEGDIYFVSNQSNSTISFSPQFRITGKAPELWNAINGSVRALPAYHINEKTTTVPLKLAPLESAFIVFRKSVNENPISNNVLVNFPQPTHIQTITGPWQVYFDPKWGPQKPVIFNHLIDWTKSSEDDIKYYSGTAVYHHHFYWDKMNNHQQIFLDLGKMIAVTKVKVNGIAVGGVWTYPYQVDITRALKKGDNTLEISVTNNWMNRIIGDLHLPKSERKTWLTFNPYKEGDPLQPSGLMGPVVLKIVNNQ